MKFNNSCAAAGKTLETMSSKPALMTDPAAHLLRGLQALADRKPRPRPFVDITSLPWDQPEFSRHFLRTATRGARYTQREIAFLQQCGVLAPEQRILDLACGGGRHSLAMARHGANVTGLDVGPAAIASARRRAARAGLAVTFVQGDVRQLAFEAAFDAVTLLFGCFTEMPREDAQTCLNGVARSLQPGGWFVLDVFAPCFFANLDGVQEWWVGQDFIAGRFPQLVLTEYFYYARPKTYARRDFICNANTGEIHAFGVSGQAYTLRDLSRLLEAAGLIPVLTCGDWDGTEATPDSELYIVVAQKPLG
jgi:SAM-dependent methyltransferase